MTHENSPDVQSVHDTHGGKARERPRCTCRNFGPVEYREVEPRCPLHGKSNDTQSWPHSHGDDPRLNEGTPHSRGDSTGACNLFVRCHDCDGRGCDSCGGTGFDWTDTQQARATIAATAGDEDAWIPSVEAAERILDDMDMESAAFWRERFASLAPRLRCDALDPNGSLRCDFPPGHPMPHASVYGSEWSRS